MPLEAIEAVAAIPEVIVGLADAGSGKKGDGGGGCFIIILVLAVIGGIGYCVGPAPKEKQPPKPTPPPTITSKVAEKTTRASKGFFKEVGRGIWKGLTE